MAIIFITGTSSGIGLATAVTLAESGHTIYAAMRNLEKSGELQEIATSKNLLINIVPLDVDDDSSVQQAIGSVLKKEGHIDVLVNNAGIASVGAVEEMPLDFFRQHMETNYFGTVRCIQAVLPSMRERKSGYIINISSIAARINGFFQGGYAATKAAVEAFSESLAQEVLPYNIRVAVVEPGVIKTSISKFLESKPSTTHYPAIKRCFAFFAASFDRNDSPSIVADAVKDIIDGKSTKFRNLAGPDALSITSFRDSMSDEDWINSVGIDDKTWIENMSQMGLDVRPYLAQYNYDNHL